jgi:hypothetical protein
MDPPSVCLAFAMRYPSVSQGWTPAKTRCVLAHARRSGSLGTSASRPATANDPWLSPAQLACPGGIPRGHPGDPLCIGLEIDVAERQGTAGQGAGGADTLTGVKTCNRLISSFEGLTSG